MVPMETEIEDVVKLEELMIKNEKNQHVRDAMKKINETYAQVIHLLYFEDMSYEEIGKVLKKNNPLITKEGIFTPQ